MIGATGVEVGEGSSEGIGSTVGCDTSGIGTGVGSTGCGLSITSGAKVGTTGGTSVGDGSGNGLKEGSGDWLGSGGKLGSTVGSGVVVLGLGVGVSIIGTLGLGDADSIGVSL